MEDSGRELIARVIGGNVVYGNPSWSAEALPDGMAFIRVTYPAGSSVAEYQTLRLPMEDLRAPLGRIPLSGA